MSFASLPAGPHRWSPGRKGAAYFQATGSLHSGDRPKSARTRALEAQQLCCRVLSHPGDELFDPLVYRPERVLAEDRALRLVVELEMDPVDGEVPPPLL